MGNTHHPEHDGTHDPHEVEAVETVPVASPNSEVEAESDVASDPALDDRLGSDWADEGGATRVGPASAAPGGVESEDSKRQIRTDREREERTQKDAEEFRGEEAGDAQSIE